MVQGPAGFGLDIFERGLFGPGGERSQQSAFSQTPTTLHLWNAYCKRYFYTEDKFAYAAGKDESAVLWPYLSDFYPQS